MRMAVLLRRGRCVCVDRRGKGVTKTPRGLPGREMPCGAVLDGCGKDPARSGAVFQDAEGGGYQRQRQQQRQQAAQNGENHQQRQCDDEEQRGGDFGKAPGDMKRQADRFNEKPDKNKNDKQGKHTIYLLFSVCRYKLQTGKPPSRCRDDRGCLRQHRTIPALRLKHRSGGCGTASALPKCSIIHKVLSALLA